MFRSQSWFYDVRLSLIMRYELYIMTLLSNAPIGGHCGLSPCRGVRGKTEGKKRHSKMAFRSPRGQNWRNTVFLVIKSWPDLVPRVLALKAAKWPFQKAFFAILANLMLNLRYRNGLERTWDHIWDLKGWSMLHSNLILFWTNMDNGHGGFFSVRTYRVSATRCTHCVTRSGNWYIKSSQPRSTLAPPSLTRM